VGGGWESFLLQCNLRVLLVEDDDSTRHVVGALLRNCNYEVTAAANGSTAWELLEDPSRNFDLVLMDMVMVFREITTKAKVEDAGVNPCSKGKARL
jgi:pseudo-response regulator 7